MRQATCHKVLLVASSGEGLRSVDVVECSDGPSGIQVKTLQVSGLLLLIVKKQLEGL